jgi:hypothetical protein
VVVTESKPTNIVKDEKGDLVTDCYSILATKRSHFSQLLNVHEVKCVRQAEVHEAGMAIEKLKRHKAPGTDHIPAELIKAVGRTFRSEILKIINL